MNVKISLSGVKEIDDVLKGLPKQLQHRVLSAAHAFAAQPLVVAARSIAPKQTSELANSIRVEKLSQKRASVIGEVNVGPSLRGKRGRIKARTVERGSVAERKIKGYGKYRKGTTRGQYKANPYMEPAFNQTKQLVESRIAEGIGKRLLSFMKRTIKRGKQ
jgi:hypothetical protein